MAAKSRLFTWLSRFVLAVCLLALLVLGLPPAAQAAVSPRPANIGNAGFITIAAVQKNTEVTVSAQGFPASVQYRVRVGPYYHFFTQAVDMGWLNTVGGGDFQFNIMLPDVVKDVNLVTVRLDSTDGRVTYNAFYNVDSGTISAAPGMVTLSVPTAGAGTPSATPAAVISTPAPATPVATIPADPQGPTRTPAPTSTPALGSTAYACQVISTVPAASVPTYWDFDAVWVVENTGYWTWDMRAVDYSYYSGDHLEKFTSMNDITATVKMGEQITLRGDMRAPGKAGTYHTVWAVHADRGPICLLPLTLIVK